MQASASEAACTAADAGRRAQTAKGVKPSWKGPNNVATFLRCLRLLDLDLREDWPGVHEDSFFAKNSHQGLQQRVRCVEWSLYRLFEIWDPAYTKDKLRPFFPPLAPLQSLNLRAALYRGLTGLKKDGILGKDTTLRKTMLEECRGDKFEEVIRCFAVAVLRKEVYGKLESGSATRAGYSEALTAQKNLTAKQRERHLPLVLAHRKFLQGKLIERGNLSEKFDDRKRRLNDAHTRLAEKRKLVVAREGELPTITPEELESVSRHVLEAWVGNEQWVETLIRGGPDDLGCTRSERFLRCETEQNSKAVQLADTSAKSLLAGLNKRIEKQQLRLQKWAQFRASLETPQQGKVATTPIQTTEPILEFAAHQELQPMAGSSKPTLSAVDTERRHDKGMDLIRAMRSELARIKKPSVQSGSPLNGLRDSFHGSANVLTTGGERENAEVPLSIYTGSHDIFSRKASADTSKHVPAESRSEHYGAQRDQKVASPLTAEVREGTTLVSGPHGDSWSLSPSQSLLDHQDLLAIHAATSGTSGGKHSRTIPAPNVSQPGSFTKCKEDFPLCEDGQALSSPSLHSEEKPLVQKTSHPDPAGSTPTSPTTDLHSLPNSPFSLPRRQAPDLLERTRKSMALLPPSSESETTNHRPLKTARKHRQGHHEKRNKHLHRNSQPSPVDHFQTPLKPKPNANTIHQNHTRIPSITIPNNDQTNATDPQLRSPLDTPASRCSTPRDQLFSDQADYASVFKSRPRVAVTPPLGGYDGSSSSSSSSPSPEPGGGAAGRGPEVGIK